MPTTPLHWNVTRRLQQRMAGDAHSFILSLFHLFSSSSDHSLGYSFIHSFFYLLMPIDLLVHSFVESYVRSLTRAYSPVFGLFIRKPIFIQSSSFAFVHSVIRFFIHSFIHSCFYSHLSQLMILQIIN